MDTVRQLHEANQAQGVALTRQTEIEIEVGRTFALQFIDATRAGFGDADTLMMAVAMAGKSGGEILRGFLREIAELIREAK